MLTGEYNTTRGFFLGFGVIALLVFFFTFGIHGEMAQADRARTANVTAILRGTHALRRIVESTDHSMQASAGFFLILGEVSASSKDEMKIRFAWRMNDGTYAISTLPLEHIRVKMDEGAVVPTITFALAADGTCLGLSPCLKAAGESPDDVLLHFEREILPPSHWKLATRERILTQIDATRG